MDVPAVRPHKTHDVKKIGKKRASEPLFYYKMFAFSITETESNETVVTGLRLHVGPKKAVTGMLECMHSHK